jgi:hypothetical protein
MRDGRGFGRWSFVFGLVTKSIDILEHLCYNPNTESVRPKEKKLDGINFRNYLSRLRI